MLLQNSVQQAPSHLIAEGPHCWQGTSAGAKDQEAENFLEKKLKGAPLGLAQTVQTAIAALQSVLSEDFKPSEIEVGCP